jgi:hypothetical protein
VNTKPLHIDQYRTDDGYTGGGYMIDGVFVGDTPVDCLMSTLDFCWCGRPESALAYIRDGLEFVRWKTEYLEQTRSTGDGYQEKWKAISDAIDARQSEVFRTAGEAYFFFYWADQKRLTEHGINVPGWLDTKGHELLDDLNELTRRGDIPENAE